MAGDPELGQCHRGCPAHRFPGLREARAALKLSVTADDILWDLLDVRVVGNGLHLGLKPGSYSNMAPASSMTMPTLNATALLGTSRGQPGQLHAGSR
jgi:hypothetical protein